MWESMLKEAFSGYELVASEALRGLHSAVLVLRRLKKDVKVRRVSKLKLGAKGWMGTKGAV